MIKEGEGQQGTEVKYRSSESAKDRLSVAETNGIPYGPTANRPRPYKDKSEKTRLNQHCTSSTYSAVSSSS